VCPQVPINPLLSVTKACAARLEVFGEPPKVVVAIDVSGQVCNTGDITLDNVSVVNDNGTPDDLTDDSTLLSGVTLPDTDDPATPENDTCASYTGSYFPSSINAGGTDPTLAAFQDTVTASGTARLGGEITPKPTASATCELCPPSPPPAGATSVQQTTSGESARTEAPAPGTHTLKVNKGRGSGRHVAGDVVTVTADAPPPGKKFAGWSGDIQILANPSISPTTATMVSSDVTIKATYKNVSP
jgi:Divergent InlB B-repeat domain